MDELYPPEKNAVNRFTLCYTDQPKLRRTMSLAVPREKRTASDVDYAPLASTDKLFRWQHTTTFLIFRLTPVIMPVHNRLCKRIFTNSAHQVLRWPTAL